MENRTIEIDSIKYYNFEMENKSVFDRLDEIKIALDHLTSSSDKDSSEPNLLEKSELESFLKKSNKKISYSDTKKNFLKTKGLIILFDILFFVFCILSTIACSVCYESPNVLSFARLFFIPIFIIFFILVLRTKSINDSYKLSKLSIFHHNVNGSGLYVKTKKIKIIWIIFVCVFCIMSIISLIFASITKPEYIPFNIFFEVLELIFLFFSTRLRFSFFKKFTVVFYEFINNVTNEKTIIVQDEKTGKLMLFKDYLLESPNSILNDYDD